jgi:hypothetical protein
MGELIDRDVEHLRLLHIAFYIMAGLAAFMSFFALIYIALGGIFVAGALSAMGNAANQIPPQLGWIFVGVGGFFLFFCLTITVLLFLAGKSLEQRRHRVFCMVMAGLCCLQIPWGTAVGICAINVLNRPSVKMLFDLQAPPVPSA